MAVPPVPTEEPQWTAWKAFLAALFTPILKGSVFNSPVTLNTDIFTEALSPTNSPTAFRIYACFDVGGVLIVRRTAEGVTVSENLNGGTVLTANAAYIFDIIVESGETINIRYGVGATCICLKILEVPVFIH